MALSPAYALFDGLINSTPKRNSMYASINTRKRAPAFQRTLRSEKNTKKSASANADSYNCVGCRGPSPKSTAHASDVRFPYVLSESPVRKHPIRPIAIAAHSGKTHGSPVLSLIPTIFLPTSVASHAPQGRRQSFSPQSENYPASVPPAPQSMPELSRRQVLRPPSPPSATAFASPICSSQTRAAVCGQ